MALDCDFPENFPGRHNEMGERVSRRPQKYH